MTQREQIKLVNIAISNTLDLYRIWAKKHKLNYNTLMILYTLKEHEPCTQKKICDFWALPKQTVHGILRELEAKGYIMMHENPDNKRERLVSFSEKGELYSDSVLKPLYEMEESVMERLGTKLSDQLVSVNMKYYEFFKEEIENGSHTG